MGSIPIAASILEKPVIARVSALPVTGFLPFLAWLQGRRFAP
jgi:hypothetical protein